MLASREWSGLPGKQQGRQGVDVVRQGVPMYNCPRKEGVFIEVF